ncbi:hypothetical protein Tco_0760564 [Tanacetum coccineum]
MGSTTGEVPLAVIEGRVPEGYLRLHDGIVFCLCSLFLVFMRRERVVDWPQEGGESPKNKCYFYIPEEEEQEQE